MVNFNFKTFFEQKLREPNNGDNKDAENYFDASFRELGVKPDMIPDYLDVGNVSIDDLCFNQVIFKIKKPIELDDPYVTLYLSEIKSPNLQQHVYYCKDKSPYTGTLQGLKTKPFMMTMDKFSELYTRPLQANLQGGGGGGMPF